MSEPRPSGADGQRLEELFEARARAEIVAADALVPGSDTVANRGALIAQVALVKGLPGPAEAAGGAALSGADGDAALRALEALGYRADDVFFTLSRPVDAEADRRGERLRRVLEAVDARVVVLLDDEAAEDAGVAFGVAPPRSGTAVTAMGRRLVAVGAFEASLANEKLKRTAWNQLKLAAPPGPVF